MGFAASFEAFREWVGSQGSAGRVSRAAVLESLLQRPLARVGTLDSDARILGAVAAIRGELDLRSPNAAGEAASCLIAANFRIDAGACVGFEVFAALRS